METGAALTLEQLDELCGEELLTDALGKWLADGAVTWNTWLKGLAASAVHGEGSRGRWAGRCGLLYVEPASLVRVVRRGVGPGMAEAAESGQEDPAATPNRRTSSGTEHQRACGEDAEDAAPDVQGWWSSSAEELMEEPHKGAA